MLKVMYEDNYILVADKPSGMAVHPSKLHQGDTLADEVREYLGMTEDEFTFRCLTRLDKDTSGLVLIAKTLEAAQKLNEDMVARRIHREYEAIVEDGNGIGDENGAVDKNRTVDKNGIVDKKGTVDSLASGNISLLPEAGIIDAPIARASSDEHDIKRCVDFEKGEKAVTHYQVIERGEGYAKVRCILETGRTHQIRVHMQYLGHPIKGDRLYNPRCVDDAGSEQMRLRAVKLAFPHPMTRLEMCVV